jgi:sigma-B regulation protein RsbU (phosphoserine phosphatase)
LAIVLGFFLFNITAFVIYSIATTENYESLRKEEVLKTVAYESERVQRIIAETKYNAIDLAPEGVASRLSAIKPTENSFVLFVSPQDNRIMYNTYKNANSETTSIKDLPWNIRDDYFEMEGVGYMVFRVIMDNGWLLSVQIPANEIFADIEERNLTFSIGTAISMVLMLCLAFYLLSKLVNHPLKQLTLGVAEISSGNFEARIELSSKDEFGVLAAAFNKMTAEFRDTLMFCISQQEKEYAEHMEKQRVEAELNVATQIQINMLPCIFPAFPHLAEFDIYATMLPAKEVGGDFYDFFLIDSNTLAVVIADVSGKGVPAALFMVIAKTLLKNTVQNGRTPKEAFETVNNILYENNEAGMFVTAFMGYLDIPSGKFTYVCAGHNPPILYSNGKYSYLNMKSGFVLAALENKTHTQNELLLKKGDELFLYTDGVTEATNGKKDLFGENRLLETMSLCAGSSLIDFAKTVKGKVSEFAEGTEQADDITILILRYQGTKEDT